MKRNTLLTTFAVCLVAAGTVAAQTTIPASGSWQELSYASGPVKSEISAGDDSSWALTGQKLLSAVPGPPGWQWQTAYENGTFDLFGLGGIYSSASGLTLQNLNNNDPNGVPEQFELSGSGVLDNGLNFKLLGRFDANATGSPDVEIFPDGNILVSGQLTEAILAIRAMSADIDIKPGSFPNSLNLGSNGVVPVAVFGSGDLDVTQIDQTTLLLEGAAAKTKGNSGKIGAFDYVNDDGYMDLVVHFPVSDLQTLQPGDRGAELTGTLLDGTALFGVDAVRIVPPKSVTPLPEPTTLVLIGLGGLILLCRRRA